MLVGVGGVAAVVDGEGRYQGTLDLDTINAAIRDMRVEAQERDRKEARGRPGGDARE
jgi:hypothetical protein